MSARRRVHPAIALATLLASLLAAPAAALDTDATSSTAAIAPADRAFVPLAEVPHLGRLVAIEQAQRGTTAVRESRIVDATRDLALAIVHDPLLGAAWTNYSAALIEACLPRDARAAATVARRLAPDDPNAAKNLRLALETVCETSLVGAVGLLDAEIAAIESQTAAESFVAAARARRERGDRLLAIFWEERALELGAAPKAIYARIGEDYRVSGLLVAAAGALEAAGDDASRAAARATLARAEELRGTALELGAALAREAGLASEDEVMGLALLAHEALADGQDEATARSTLEHALRLDQPRWHEWPGGSLALDRSWAALGVEVVRGRAPYLVLRRFPGDTQLALYAWEPVADEPPEVTLARALADVSATTGASWKACAGETRFSCRVLDMEIDAGAEGRAPALAALLGPGEGSATIVAIGVWGDSGCGDACRTASRAALEAAIAAIVPRDAAVASGARDAREPRRDGLALPMPAAWRAARPHDERRDPWLTQPVADDLRIDVPPGLVVARIEPGFADENAAPATALWLRGEFLDQEGLRVRIGDERFAGTVDVYRGEAAGVGSDGIAARLAPRADPKARFRASADLGPSLSRARTGAAGKVARFEGAAFRGEWIVHELAHGDDRVVIALPAALGHRSLALHWIAVTLRRAEAEPPPPPVDLSARQGIAYRKLDASSRTDPREGLLDSGDLSLATPRGYRVSMSGYSANGFPVTMRDASGSRVILERLAPGDAATLEARQRQVEALHGLARGGWAERRMGRDARCVTAELVPEEGRERRVWLLVPKDHASAAAYRILAVRGETQIESEWELAIDVIETSLRYRAPR